MAGLLTDNVEFNIPLESDQNFPPTTITAQAKLNGQFVSLSNDKTEFDHCIFTHSGRTALALAGRMLKHNNQSNVILIPSFHCPAAVEPFIWLDYKIAFFKINNDLTPNIEHMKQLISELNVTHCLVINYFGFGFISQAVSSLLHENKISLISDCAHSIYTLLNEVNNPDSPAQASICSINKMLPTIDGGLLYSKNTKLPKLNQHDWWTELKAIAYTLGIVKLINKFRPNEESKQTYEENKIKPRFRYFSPENINAACFAHTQAILRYSDLNNIAQQRQENFRYLAQHLANSTQGQLIFNSFNDDEVPYVFPFLAASPLVFNKLRDRNIQCLRWEEVAHSDCDISQTYRKHLLQLPCHHMLTKPDLDKIIEVLK